MFVANDLNGNRVDINNAKPEERYFCPICGFKLIQRRGEVNTHHFAHEKGGYELCDSWHYDMSEWHRNWQEQFPEECREVVVEHDGKKHRADVLINGTVIEFQHSRMSSEEFHERNSFYTSAGYNIIWLFDMIDDYHNIRIYPSYGNRYSYDWLYHWKTFDGFDPSKERNIYVCFQFSKETESEHDCIEHLSWFSDDRKHFSTEHSVNFNTNSFVEFSRNYTVPTFTFENTDSHDSYHKNGKTLLEILKTSNSKVIIASNIKSGKRVKVGNSDYYKDDFIRTIKGYLSRKDDKYKFYTTRVDIYYWNKPEWILEWEAK